MQVLEYFRIVARGEKKKMRQKHESNVTGTVGVTSDCLSQTQLNFENKKNTNIVRGFIVVSSSHYKQGAQVSQ